MARLVVDLAPAAFRTPTDPGVLLIRGAESDVVAVFDSWGSWGSGMEVAGQARSAAAERWALTPPPTIDVAIDDVHEIARSVAKPQDDLDDCAFDGVVAITTGESFWLAAAGSLGVILIGADGPRILFRPRMLIDMYLETQSLTPEEIEGFPHKEVCAGPYLGSEGVHAPLVRSGPHLLAPGDYVVVAERRLRDALLGPDNAFIGGPPSARALQSFALAKRWPGCPVVVLSNPR